MKRKLITLLAVICLVALLVPMSVSAAAPENGWHQNDDKTWSYYREGVLVSEEVIKLGNVYYGFDEYGIMYDGEDFWCDGYFYRAKAGGALYTNAWYQDGEYWYYYLADAKGADDFLKIGGVWYFFYGDGQMAVDSVVWSNNYNCYYVLNKAGTDSKALQKGWNQVYGAWYYVYEDAWGNLSVPTDQILEIGGQYYYFHYTGKMADAEMIWCENPVTGYFEQMVATAGGPLLRNGWGKADGKWYYAQNFQLFEDEIVNIGGTLYYFDHNGAMRDIPGNLHHYGEDYYVGSGGALLRNQWRKNTTGSSDEVGWVYYGEEGYKLTNLVKKIGAYWYWFDDNGVMQTNSYVETETLGVFVFDANGYGKQVNGWFQDPVTKEWLYAYEGHLLYGFWTINNVTYCFDEYSGHMLTNTYAFDYETNECYALDKNGAMITAKGWHLLDGCWVYAEEGGALAQGWKEDGNGNVYYLTPQMVTNTTEYCDSTNEWFAFGDNGIGVRLTGTGFKDVGYYRVYVKNGVPVGDEWIYYNGAWYYTWYDGEPYANGVYEVNGQLYVFDSDGKMVTNRWMTFSDMYSDYLYICYADANGQPLEGKHTIGGKTYFFGYEGRLIDEEFCEWEGVYYWLNADGSVKTTLVAGWNQIGGKWYYFDDEYCELLTNDLVYYNGYYYGFDAEGVMLSGGLKYAWWDWYIFADDGRILTGWQQIGGKWYYADPSSTDPSIYWEGIYYIDDVDYLFKNGYLQGGTYYDWAGFYTANSAGVVTKYTPYPDGWTYVDGSLRYLKNGEPVTGWVGDYFVEYGDVILDSIVEYAGNYYYMRPDGRYLKSGWYETGYGFYVYAKSGGVLACSEWLQQGNTWYYFDGPQMLADGEFYVNGTINRFAASGAWLGKVTTPGASSSNGWKQIGGKWYYYNNGRPLTGMCYVSNTWYCFDYEGAMIANGAGEDIRTNKLYYFGSGGARANYVGWKQISGQWLYFNADHSLDIGIKTIGGKIYGFGYVSSLNAPVMVSNMAVVMEGKLYIFNSNGICNGAETGSGWKQAGGEWYYLINGQAVFDRDITIGGVNYHFYEDGTMATNAVCLSDEYSCYVYYNANGAAVRKAGWYQTSKGWIYIQSNGAACYNGIYKIGNTAYSFRHGYWVS